MKRDEKNSKSIDFKLSVALMASLVVLTFQYLVLILFGLIDTSLGSMIQLGSKIVVAIFFIYAFPSMWVRNGKAFMVIYGITISIFLFHYLFYEPNRPVLLSLIFPIFFMSLPALVYTLALRDLKEFYRVSKKAAYLIFVFGIIISLSIFGGYSSIETYSMSLSYYMLFPILIFISDFMDKYKVSSFIFSVVALMIILSLGSRGALLCIGIFIILKLIRLDSNSLRRAIILRLTVLVSILVVAVNFQTLLYWLDSKFEQYGISSRTIQHLQTGSVDLNERDLIANTVLSGVKNNPIAGNGLAGDRVLAETYSHNFFIEAVSSFGVFTGLLIGAFLLLLIARTLIASDKFNYDFIILWLCLGFVSLMVSGSFLIEMKFWILFGLLVTMNFQLSGRKNKEYE